jgi:pyruvate dehydrogenase E1 component
MNDLPTHDVDPQETQEWIEAIEAVIERDGLERAHYLLRNLAERAVTSGVESPYLATTPYINTIPPEEEARRPGDYDMERRLKSLMRWNAMAMVLRANKHYPGLGGHIASYQSMANLFAERVR